MGGRALWLATAAMLVTSALLAPALLARFAMTGLGGGAAALAVLALTAVTLWAARLTQGMPDGRLAEWRRRWAPPIMLAFLVNGGVRTVTIATDAPTASALVTLTHGVAVLLSLALAVLLVGPVAERLARGVRAEG